MLIHSAIQQLVLCIAASLSAVALSGCKGKDVNIDDDSNTIDRDQGLDQYIVTEIDLDGTFDPQKIQIDSERGVIFVPTGYFVESDGPSRLIEFDLASGQQLQTYGSQTRFPLDFVELSITGKAVVSAVEWETISDITIDSLDRQTSTYFEVDHLIDELKFNDQYLFLLNETRNKIHQYDVTTGEHLGQIDTAYADDWLITQRASKLYVLSNGEVSEYDFSQGVAVNYTRPLSISSAAATFGWLNPDETLLYQTNGEVVTVPEFHTRSPNPSGLSDARRSFLDIAFAPDSNKHYTIESYSGIDGDVFLSSLENHEVEPLGLVGRRIFVSSAGVHLYAYEDGKHRLYALKQNNKEPYKTGDFSIPPRLTHKDFNPTRYVAQYAMYPIGLYAKAWPDLFLRFDAPSRNNLYHGEQIIIEPICFSEGCTSGAYSAKIPPNSQSIHVTVRLANWFQVNDFRGLAGFRVRTPEGSWNDFDLQNVNLTNVDPAGCVDIVDTTVLVFCDE